MLWMMPLLLGTLVVLGPGVARAELSLSPYPKSTHPTSALTIYTEDVSALRPLPRSRLPPARPPLFWPCNTVSCVMAHVGRAALR
jgi:hypothetical protein